MTTHDSFEDDATPVQPPNRHVDETAPSLNDHESDEEPPASRRRVDARGDDHGIAASDVHLPEGLPPGQTPVDNVWTFDLVMARAEALRATRTPIKCCLLTLDRTVDFCAKSPPQVRLILRKQFQIADGIPGLPTTDVTIAAENHEVHIALTFAPPLPSKFNALRAFASWVFGEPPELSASQRGSQDPAAGPLRDLLGWHGPIDIRSKYHSTSTPHLYLVCPTTGRKLLDLNPWINWADHMGNLLAPNKIIKATTCMSAAIRLGAEDTQLHFWWPSIYAPAVGRITEMRRIFFQARDEQRIREKDNGPEFDFVIDHDDPMDVPLVPWQQAALDLCMQEHVGPRVIYIHGAPQDGKSLVIARLQAQVRHYTPAFRGTSTDYDISGLRDYNGEPYIIIDDISIATGGARVTEGAGMLITMVVNVARKHRITWGGGRAVTILLHPHVTVVTTANCTPESCPAPMCARLRGPSGRVVESRSWNLG